MLIFMFLCPITDEVTLKPLERRHATALFELIERNRDYLRPWLHWVNDTRSKSDCRAYIATERAQQASDNGFTAGIWVHDALAGVISIFRFDRTHHSAFIGYWLDQAHTGRGIMTQVCKQVIVFAFENFDLHRLELRAAVENQPSRAIAKRLGFTEEGIARQSEWIHDQYIDLVVYSLLKHELEFQSEPNSC